MRIRKLITFILCVSMAASLLAGCKNKEETESTSLAAVNAGATDNTYDITDIAALDRNIKATLVLATYDKNNVVLYNELDLQGRFQKLYPHVTIEIEQTKDDSEYWNSMKIRAAASELPDLMYNKPFTFARFKDYVFDLNDTKAAADNVYTKGYKFDGKVLGVAEKATQDYVYYWTDMFDKAGVQVPTTWSELLDISKKLQDYYSVGKPDFMAIGLGAKDEWPTYPFMEFMPAVESGNGKTWNLLATQDEPFAEGTDINKTYKKVNQLFTSGVCGKDPLGLGLDQTVSLFAQKQASMLAAGPWCLEYIKQDTDDISKLSTFYLPVRDNLSDEFRTIVQGDSFLSVTKDSKNPELAKAFLEFYFSDAWYPDFISRIGDDSTMTSFPKDKNPIFKAADDKQPDVVLVTYDGGNDDFSRLMSETKFDYKKLGSQMFSEGFDLDKELADLDTRWKAARNKLGIQ
jgi:raffinose/stachyose/melibiose transport system substrate-binding protein